MLHLQRADSTMDWFAAAMEIVRSRESDEHLRSNPVCHLVVFACSAGSAANAWAQAQRKCLGSARAHYKDGRANYQLGEYRAPLGNSRKPTASSRMPRFSSISPSATDTTRIRGGTAALSKLPARCPDAKNHEEVERFIREITLLIEQEKGIEVDRGAHTCASGSGFSCGGSPGHGPASPSSTPSAANAAAVRISRATPSVPAVAAVPHILV